MSQLNELESRITAAMERIQAGLGALSDRMSEQASDLASGLATADKDSAQEDVARAEALAEALEEEKLATAQLEERLKQIKAKHGEEIAALEAQIAGAGEAEALRTEAEALRTENEDLKALLADTSEVVELKQEVARLTVALAERDQSDVAATEALQAQLAKQAETAARLDMDVQRLRQSNDQLREVNATLRETNQAAVGEPALINKAMLAELEGLRAIRATDAAEAGAILARLEPLLANAVSLPKGEDE
ncbi:hypothetical protein [Antarcticimicrobium sediminis]|uniref:Uncharacterized protein n=1 Tax=Antarcticimicrobium sediminis TaxID=2546227 RepID=A0A4R5EL93_9RHOB|nr:hypothetical protein [Antarcticimicrobium sediminis]TDE35227.1 hypothetical protein E1B25_17615 [Antarcticimicrobium sediminis]